jgi:hypothetical protein
MFVGLMSGIFNISLLGIFNRGYGGKLGTTAWMATTLFQLILPYWPRFDDDDADEKGYIEMDSTDGKDLDNSREGREGRETLLKMLSIVRMPPTLPLDTDDGSIPTAEDEKRWTSDPTGDRIRSIPHGITQRNIGYTRGRYSI